MIIGEDYVKEIDNISESSKRANYFYYLLATQDSVRSSYIKALKGLEEVLHSHLHENSYLIRIVDKVSYSEDIISFLLEVSDKNNPSKHIFYEIYDLLGDYFLIKPSDGITEIGDMLDKNREISSLFIDLFKEINTARTVTSEWLDYRLSKGYLPYSSTDTYEIHYEVSFKDIDILLGSLSRYYSTYDDLPLNLTLGAYLRWVYDRLSLLDTEKLDKILSLSAEKRPILNGISTKDSELTVLALVYLLIDTDLISLSVEDTDISKLAQEYGLFSMYSFSCEVEFIYNILHKVNSIDLLSLLLTSRDLSILDEVSINFKPVLI